MAKKQDAYYFETFTACLDDACKAAQLLDRSMREFDPAQIKETLDEMHNIEHAADDKKHELLNVLAKAFITPIEREDITALAQEIDNVTDNIEEVALRAYMYNISAVLPQAVRFGELVGRCCQALEEVVKEFRHFRKSPTLYQKIVAVNELEGEGDQLYTQAVRSLYTQAAEPAALLAWSALYDQLESCCDACEHVADIVETVVMKNS